MASSKYGRKMDDRCFEDRFITEDHLSNRYAHGGSPSFLNGTASDVPKTSSEGQNGFAESDTDVCPLFRILPLPRAHDLLRDDAWRVNEYGDMMKDHTLVRNDEVVPTSGDVRRQIHVQSRLRSKARCGTWKQKIADLVAQAKESGRDLRSEVRCAKEEEQHSAASAPYFNSRFGLGNEYGNQKNQKASVIRFNLNAFEDQSEVCKLEPISPVLPALPHSHIIPPEHKVIDRKIGNGLYHDMKPSSLSSDGNNEVSTSSEPSPSIERTDPKIFTFPSALSDVKEQQVPRKSSGDGSFHFKLNAEEPKSAKERSPETMVEGVTECPKPDEVGASSAASESVILEEAISLPELTASQRADALYDFYSAKCIACKNSFVGLESDPSLKSLKSAVLFASSNPVVTCSSNSPMEIIEPYRKAFMLLRGAEVETNSIKIRLDYHPEIVHFVRYNMARKFVELAALQLEEKNEKKLFALATLLTELWACDEEFGQVFLSMLYSEYPALIGKSGLKSEGNLQKYIDRLGAVSKFYAAVMQTERRFLLKRLFPTRTFEDRNPHGVDAAWNILVGVVNCDIQIGVTALVLRNLLVIAGWILNRTYGKQFNKIMILISRQILPKIQKKTPPELSAPVQRLAILLEEYHKAQSIPIPENRLSEYFWM